MTFTELALVGHRRRAARLEGADELERARLLLAPEFPYRPIIPSHS